MVDSNRFFFFFVHVIYVGVFLFLELFSSFSTYCHEMLIKHILEKVWILRMCATLGDNMCPMHEIINSNTLLHFVLSHNVTRYTNSPLSCIHVDTREIRNITLVATGVILRSSQSIHLILRGPHYSSSILIHDLAITT